LPCRRRVPTSVWLLWLLVPSSSLGSCSNSFSSRTILDLTVAGWPPLLSSLPRGFSSLARELLDTRNVASHPRLVRDVGNNLWHLMLARGSVGFMLPPLPLGATSNATAATVAVARSIHPWKVETAESVSSVAVAAVATVAASVAAEARHSKNCGFCVNAGTRQQHQRRW